jgi:serine/threonine protein phosphatase 1
MGDRRERSTPAWLEKLIATFAGPRAAGGRLPRLSLQPGPSVAYAIGDVHGRLDLLRQLEAAIVADAAGRSSEKALVMLGDYVDRGPESAGVIDHLLSPPPAGFTRYCLAGNHDLAMKAFLTDPARNWDWLDLGGDATLASYDIPPPRQPDRQLKHALAAHIPYEHQAFLNGLAIALETPQWIFVHAGLRPGASLKAQTDADLVSFRDGFAATYEDVGKIVVHGHSASTEPKLSKFRVGIDTGAYATGRLSAVRLESGKDPSLLSTH